jgi:hypothetical protein
VRKPDIVARVLAKMAQLGGSAPPSPPPTGLPASASAAPAALPAATINQICTLAAGSQIAPYEWQNRGRAPLGYIKGMAVVFATVYSKLKNGDPCAAAMAAAEAGDSQTDALAWYHAVFAAAGMSNAVPGADTLRHLFVLLLGLGMRESSGRFCEGRDTSAHNISSDTAEAGLFQMSWDAHTASPFMPQLFASYSNGTNGFLSIFQEGVECGHGDLANFGEGAGAAFQQLCKSCPAFAVETAAIGLRVSRSHWGPINNRAAEIRPDADMLLQQVQSIIDG